ncbi:hypothetical protein DIPPA_27888 [Diplonema papillatum]|nr:hypothetical protein DIPPA_27888 [Diplonema papillatum]
MPLVTPLPDGPSRYPPSMPRSRTPSDASRHADEITRQKPSITADDLFPGGSRRPSLAGPSHHQYPQPSNYASGRGRQSPTPPSKYALSQDVVDHFETFDPDAAVRSRRSTGRSGSFAAQTQYRPPGTQALTTPPPPFGGNSPYDSQQRQLEGESAAYFARGPTAPGTGAPQQHHPQQMQQQQPPQVLQYQHSNQLAEHVEMQRQGMLHGGPHPKDISPQRCPDTAANQTPATSALGIEREALSARIDDIDSMLNGPPIECDRMNNLLLERQRHAARLAILTPEKDAFMEYASAKQCMLIHVVHVLIRTQC